MVYPGRSDSVRAASILCPQLGSGPVSTSIGMPPVTSRVFSRAIGIWRRKREDGPSIGFSQVVFHSGDATFTQRTDFLLVQPRSYAAEVELVMLAGQSDSSLRETFEADHTSFRAGNVHLSHRVFETASFLWSER